MKKVYKNQITNIENTDLFDNRFLFDKLAWESSPQPHTRALSLEQPQFTLSPQGEGGAQGIKIIYLSKLLEKRKNIEILEKVKAKPAMYSMVYSPEDELEIFTELFNDAIKNKKKIHIVGVTLDEEIKMLEKYYEELGFLRDDINCFAPDFSIPLVTVSVKIENLMWRGSDYKRMREKIFFNPPIRESGQVKAMFKGINRGVIAGIYCSPPARGELEGGLSENVKEFLQEQVKSEYILPITLSKILCHNLEEVGIIGDKNNFVIEY